MATLSDLAVEIAGDINGKASASHPALYDSGARNMAASITADWTVAARGVRLSRRGSSVSLIVDVNRVTDATSSFGDLLPIPAGFRPIAPGYISPGKSSSGAEFWWDMNGTTLRFRDRKGDLLAGHRITNVLSWQTDDAIPSTLPGTPA